MDGTKIGYLIPRFPGQAHASIWREIEEVQRLGAEVALLSTRVPPMRLVAHSWSSEAIPRTLYLGRPRLLGALPTLAGVPAAIVAEARDGGYLGDLLLCAEPARRLARHCAAHGIPHVHVHSGGRAALVAALARSCFDGAPYSLTAHAPLDEAGPGQALKWRGAAFGVTITRKLRAEIAVMLGSEIAARCVVQPMGVDAARFTRFGPYEPPAAGTPFRIFSCGRLAPSKGFDELMRAVAILVARGVDARLEIAGEDDRGGAGYRETLRKRVVELDLSERVRLLGPTSEDRVRSALSDAHVFALAAWHEPLGDAYMEAMSCEVPVVGTDAGGARELIEPGVNGVLVPPRDPDALAQALAALSADPGRCRALGLAGRSTVVRSFQTGPGARLILDQIAAADRPAPARAAPRRAIFGAAAGGRA